MKAIPAIYLDGSVQFTMEFPDYLGPVSVLVVFPEADDFECAGLHEREYFEGFIEKEELDLDGSGRLDTGYWDPLYDKKLERVF